MRNIIFVDLILLLKKLIIQEGVVPNCTDFGIKCLKLCVLILSTISEEKSINRVELFTSVLEVCLSYNILIDVFNI